MTSYSSAAYPGKYSPSAVIKKIVSDLSGIASATPLQERMIVREYEQYVRLALPLKGAVKEDIVVMINGGILSVAVSAQNTENITDEPGGEEGSEDVMISHIQLPGNIDTQFACAEYKNDMLEICFSKTDSEPQQLSYQLIVY